MFKGIYKGLQEKTPLVHNITNYVTVNDVANIILSSGGAPLMADDINEVEEIVGISNALYINIGTLNKRTIESMIAAGKKANELNIPVVLDPVGMGASTLRNETVATLIDNVKFHIIKGNMSEIKGLYINAKNSGGVDVQEQDIVGDGNLEESIEFIKKVAEKFECTIAVTGAIDIVTDGKQTAVLRNGHQMMSQITGTGCMTGSVIATYAACGESFEAAVSGITAMAISGERAFEKIKERNEGTGSFRVYMIDYLSAFSLKDYEEDGRVEIR